MYGLAAHYGAEAATSRRANRLAQRISVSRPLAASLSVAARLLSSSR
jgi:hypothetical protein